MQEFRYLVPGSVPKPGSPGQPKEGRDKTNTVLMNMTEAELQKKLCVWSMKTYHYYVFDSVSEFEVWQGLQPPADRTFFEVIGGGAPQRLKIDCDQVPNEAVRHACMEAVKGAWLEKYGSVQPAPPIYLFRTGAISYHITIDHYVKDVAEALTFFTAVRDRLDDEYNGSVDERVYSRRQNWRIVGSSKEPGGFVKKLLNGGPQTSLAQQLIGRYSA